MVLPWRWWLELREVVLGFSKDRGYIAASFSFTTSKPPFKGALVAALLLHPERKLTSEWLLVLQVAHIKDILGMPLKPKVYPGM